MPQEEFSLSLPRFVPRKGPENHRSIQSLREFNRHGRIGEGQLEHQQKIGRILTISSSLPLTAPASKRSSFDPPIRRDFLQQIPYIPEGFFKTGRQRSVVRGRTEIFNGSMWFMIFP